MERGEAVLAIIESAGISLSRNGEKIVARPSDLVTEAAASTIKNYKVELLEALRRRDGHGGRDEGAVGNAAHLGNDPCTGY